jgi:hypothetical protein
MMANLDCQAVVHRMSIAVPKELLATGYQDRMNAMKKPGRWLHFPGEIPNSASNPRPQIAANDSMQHSGTASTGTLSQKQQRRRLDSAQPRRNL